MKGPKPRTHLAGKIQRYLAKMWKFRELHDLDPCGVL
jgi:hypothetical protein